MKTDSPPRGSRALIERCATSSLLAPALIVFAAFLSFALSVTLWFTGSRIEGIFVGIWVPSILALGSLLVQVGARRA